MKRSFKITGLLLAVSIVCSITLSAQGRGRGADNYSRMQGYGREYGIRHSNDSLPCLAYGNMRGMGPFNQGRQGIGYGPHDRGGFNPPAGRQTPGLGRLDNLPGITDKQKKEIIDLRYKQMAEIEKFRVDNQSKMKVMREEHKKKMLELLTESQKKVLEAGVPKATGDTQK